VVIHALQQKWVRVGDEDWAVYVGRNVSMAHGALVHGPCYVGDDTFIGFNAVVHDSVVGSRCFIGIGAIVVGVEIPDGRFVPHGSIVASQDAVDALPPAAHAQHEFNEDVVHVNRGLAVAYQTADDRLRRALFDVRHHSAHERVPAHEAHWERPTQAELRNRF
jgi:SulP family sulfate permease